MPNESPQTTAAISSEEARALLTVAWELTHKLDKILQRLDSLLGPQANDPRNKPSPFKSCY